MTVIAIIIGVLVGALAGKFTYPAFFSSAEDFAQSVRYSFTPDIISLLRRRYIQDVTKSLKLGIWCALIVLAGYATGCGFLALVPR